MSFNIQKEVDVSQSYPDFALQISEGKEMVTINYEVISLENLLAGEATINYTSSIDGVKSPLIFQFSFKYSGTGNPLDEGEQALKKYLQL